MKVFGRAFEEIGGIKAMLSVAVLVCIFTAVFTLDSASHAAALSACKRNWWIGSSIDAFQYACTLVAFAFILPSRVSKWLYTVLVTWTLVIVAVCVFLKVNFGIPFQGEAALILMGSSWQEVKDFLMMYLKLKWLAGLVMFVAVLFLVAYVASKCDHCKSGKWSTLLFFFMFVPFLVWHLIFPAEVPEVFGIWERIKPFTVVRYGSFSIIEDIYKGLDRCRDMADAGRAPDLPSAIPFAGSKTNEILGVVVIGESATRNRWSVYGYERKTTPCVEKMESELFLFKDLVSMASSTTKSLRYIFSAASTESESSARYFLPSVCRRGGYDGVFLSAQNHWGQFDGVDAVVFHDCQKKLWLKDRPRSPISPVYDEELLPMIKEEVCCKFARKALFVHLQGSHQDVKCRYPSNFSFFGKNENGDFSPTKSDHYDNSIRYTDSFLDQVVSLVKARNCPSFVIYVSDHGESPGSHLWRYTPDPDVWEVPMFVWVSDKYKMLYPEIVDGLAAAVDKPLCSDQLLHGFVRLFLLEGIPDYSEYADFLSTKFEPRKKRYNSMVEGREGR